MSFIFVNVLYTNLFSFTVFMPVPGNGLTKRRNIQHVLYSERHCLKNVVVIGRQFISRCRLYSFNDGIWCWISTREWNASERRINMKQQNRFSGRWGSHKLPVIRALLRIRGRLFEPIVTTFLKFKKSKAVLRKVKTEMSVYAKQFGNKGVLCSWIVQSW